MTMAEESRKKQDAEYGAELAEIYAQGTHEQRVEMMRMTLKTIWGPLREELGRLVRASTGELTGQTRFESELVSIAISDGLMVDHPLRATQLGLDFAFGVGRFRLMPDGRICGEDYSTWTAYDAPVSHGVQEGDGLGLRSRSGSSTTSLQEATMNAPPILHSTVIRQLAKKHGFTSARRLAAASGVNLQVCQKLVTGKGRFLEETLVAFAAFFLALESQPKG